MLGTFLLGLEIAVIIWFIIDIIFSIIAKKTKNKDIVKFVDITNYMVLILISTTNFIEAFCAKDIFGVVFCIMLSTISFSIFLVGILNEIKK